MELMEKRSELKIEELDKEAEINFMDIQLGDIEKTFANISNSSNDGAVVLNSSLMPDGGVIILDYVLTFKTPSDDPTVGGNVHFKLMRLNGSNVNPDGQGSFQTELNYLDPTTKEVYRPFSLRFVDLIEAGNTNNYKYLQAFPDHQFFVDPIPHDGGTAVGCALDYWRDINATN